MSLLLRHRRSISCWFVAILGLFGSATSNATHSDVWLVLEGNQTTLSDVELDPLIPGDVPVLVEFESGRFLFEGDFDDAGQGAEGTDDPGFQSGIAFTIDSILNYRALGSLMYWNGSEWVNSVVDQERIQIEDAIGTVTEIDVNGVVNAVGAIEQALNGSVHQHIDYTIDNSRGSGVVAPGAYLIELEVFFTDGVGGPVEHTASEPFHIAFKYQITDEQFEEAIQNRVLPSHSVPIPFAFSILFALLLVVIAFATTRTSKINGR